MNSPSIEEIIEQLQRCIVDARAMRLKMLEQLLSIALLEAYETRDQTRKVRTSSTH